MIATRSAAPLSFDNPKATLAISDTLNLKGLAADLPPVNAKRPAHRRCRSTRSERINVLREIRHIFQRGLTKSWGTSADFKALARDFLAVSIGLSPGHAVKNYSLNQFQTVLLAIELARVINTADVILINDPSNQVLTVCHTLTLGRRLERAARDDATFVVVDSGKPVTVNHPLLDLPWLNEAHETIRNVLRSSSEQVIQTSAFGWSESLTRRRMLTLIDWLIDAPVCYVLEERPIPDHPIQDLLKDERFWKFSLRLDGHDPENDHTFTTWRIPVSVFTWEPASAELSPAPSDGVQKLYSFTAVQDRLQSKMFYSLNAIDMAGKIWTEVSIISEA